MAIKKGLTFPQQKRVSGRFGNLSSILVSFVFDSSVTMIWAIVAARENPHLSRWLATISFNSDRRQTRSLERSKVDLIAAIDIFSDAVCIWFVAERVQRVDGVNRSTHRLKNSLLKGYFENSPKRLNIIILPL
jgi:hypothetical protein